MHHQPSSPLEIENSSQKKARLGILFFFIYLFFYAGFVLIGVFNYELLANDIGGINIALIYGIGLIVFAVVLGVLYNFLCSRYEDQMNDREVEA